MLHSRLRWAFIIGAIVVVLVDVSWLSLLHYYDVQHEFVDSYLREQDARNLQEKEKNIMFLAIDKMFDIAGVYEIKLDLFTFMINSTETDGMTPHLRLRYFQDTTPPQWAACTRPYTRSHCMPGGIAHKNWLRHDVGYHFSWQFQCDNSDVSYYSCLKALRQSHAYNLWLMCGARYFRFGFSFTRDTGKLNTHAKPFFCGKKTCVEADVIHTLGNGQIILQLFPTGSEPTYIACTAGVENDLFTDAVSWVTTKRMGSTNVQSDWSEQFQVRLKMDGYEDFDTSVHMAEVTEDGHIMVSIGGRMWQLTNRIVTPSTNSFRASLSVSGYFGTGKNPRAFGSMYSSHTEGRYIFLSKNKKFDVIGRANSLFWFDTFKNRVTLTRWDGNFLECAYNKIKVSIPCSNCEDFYEFGSSTMKFKSNTGVQLKMAPITAEKNEYFVDGWQVEQEDFPNLQSFVFVQNANTDEIQLFGRLDFELEHLDKLEGFIPVCIDADDTVHITCIYKYRDDNIYHSATLRGTHMILYCTQQFWLGDCIRYQFIYFMSTNKFTLAGYRAQDTVMVHTNQDVSRFYQVAETFGLLVNPEDAHKSYSVFPSLMQAQSYREKLFKLFQSKGELRAEAISEALLNKMFGYNSTKVGNDEDKQAKLQKASEDLKKNEAIFQNLTEAFQHLQEEQKKLVISDPDPIKTKLDGLKDKLAINDAAIERLEKMERKLSKQKKALEEKFEKATERIATKKKEIEEKEKEIEELRAEKESDEENDDAKKEKDKKEVEKDDEEEKDKKEVEKDDDEKGNDDGEDKEKRNLETDLYGLKDLRKKKKALKTQLKREESTLKLLETSQKKKTSRWEKCVKKLETFKASRKGYETEWDETRDKLSKRDEKRETNQKQLQTLSQDLEKAKYKRSVLGGMLEQQELQTFTVVEANYRVNLKRKMEWISKVTGKEFHEVVDLEIEDSDVGVNGTQPSVCEGANKCYGIVENKIKEPESAGGLFNTLMGTPGNEKEVELDGTVKFKNLGDDPFQIVRLDSNGIAKAFGFLTAVCKTGPCFTQDAPKFQKMSRHMLLLFPAAENMFFTVRRATGTVHLYNVNLNHVESVQTAYETNFFKLPTGQKVVLFAGDYWDLNIFDRLYKIGFEEHINYRPIELSHLQINDLEEVSDSLDEDGINDREPPINKPVFYVPKFNENELILSYFKKSLYKKTKHLLSEKNSEKLEKLLSEHEALKPKLAQVEDNTATLEGEAEDNTAASKSEVEDKTTAENEVEDNAAASETEFEDKTTVSEGQAEDKTTASEGHAEENTAALEAPN